MKSGKNDKDRSLVDLLSFAQHYFLPAKLNLREFKKTPTGFHKHAVCRMFEVYWWLHLGVEIGYYPTRNLGCFWRN